eukprot:c13033_g1_i2.p1 GENE.c13033_g1_i2~~c13033_g1_i2.p1  ORF type:complete len:569 (-),score=182.49 c13033_g1_i2:191-1897(-)
MHHQQAIVPNPHHQQQQKQQEQHHQGLLLSEHNLKKLASRNELVNNNHINHNQEAIITNYINQQQQGEDEFDELIMSQGVSQVQPTAEELRARVPLAMKCFIWVLGGCVGVTAVLFVVAYADNLLGPLEGSNTGGGKADVSKMEGGGGDVSKNLQPKSWRARLRAKIDDCVGREGMGAGVMALQLGPVIGGVVLFIMLRAKTQLVDMSSEQYKKAEIGMTCLTFGLMFHAFHCMTIRFSSEFFGPLSYFCGVLLNLFGSSIAVWSLFALQSPSHPHHTLTHYIAAIVCLYLFVAVLIPLTHVMGRVSKHLEADNLHEVKVLASLSLMPSLVSVCMFVYFRPWTTTDESVPHFVSGALYICTVAQFSLVIGSLFSSESNRTIDNVGRIIRSASLLLLTVFFVVLVYLLFVLPNPTVAITGFLVMSILSIVVNLWLAVLNEAITFNRTHASPEQHESLRLNLHVTSGLTQLISVLLMYIHLRPSILLAEENATTFYESSTPYLSGTITLVVVGVIVQLFGEAVQFFAVSNSNSGSASSKMSVVLAVAAIVVGLVCLDVGVVVLIDAATEV